MHIYHHFIFSVYVSLCFSSRIVLSSDLLVQYYVCSHWFTKSQNICGMYMYIGKYVGKFCSTCLSYWEGLCIIEYGFKLCLTETSYPLERELRLCTVCRMQGFDFGRRLINWGIRESFLHSKFLTITVN